jgi:hypothetical protein
VVPALGKQRRFRHNPHVVYRSRPGRAALPLNLPTMQERTRTDIHMDGHSHQTCRQTDLPEGVRHRPAPGAGPVPATRSELLGRSLTFGEIKQEVHSQVYPAGEIDFFENLDIVHFWWLVAGTPYPRPETRGAGAQEAHSRIGGSERRVVNACTLSPIQHR